MKLANRAYVITLILLMLVFSAWAQTDARSDKDDRNTAPTVGTGGAMGGPTGLFTVYDGQTLRKGEYTISAAYSNYDRDPGNVDITSVPLSFQIGVWNKLELFFATEGWRGVKVNNPRNLSSFYLPNVNLYGSNSLLPAIVLAPNGGGPNIYLNSAVFRPAGMPFSAFPYTGLTAGNYGLPFSGPVFGFAAATNATLGPPRKGGASDLFPGVGSVYGSILPGIVLSTVADATAAGGQRPTSFTTAPSYLPDAPFIAQTYGTSSFNSFDVGFKWRFNDIKSSWGTGVSVFYRWYADNATTASGFKQMQQGAGSGSNKGDIGITYFADARVTKWANVSANVGYVYTTKVSGNFSPNRFVMLDPPDEFTWSVGADFIENKYLQYIFEFRSLRYVGGHTPNAFQQNPYDGIAGVRVFPKRWFGFGFAYRYNFNQQNSKSFDNNSSTANVFVRQGTITTQTGVPSGFNASEDPNGYIAQFWVGHRDKREGPKVNGFANVDGVDLTATVISLPCRPGYKSRSGGCNDSKTIGITTHASDPENDVLTYNYTVSGGRIVGTGANVQWDLSGAQPGTYTITTGVDDGCGVCGKTDTKTIKVQECSDCVQICDCPGLTVSGPSGITNAGDNMTFTASTSGDVTYNWSVSAGTITSGQGTPSITVSTTMAMAGTNVTATVDIGGRDPNCGCVTNAAETAGVATREGAKLVDEFGALKDDDVKARVDNFYIQLNNNPNAKGYIINYGSAADIKKRRAQIMKAITFRKYDVSRVTFVDGPDNKTGVDTKFYLVPAGADNPTP